jgi:hypothetical protein
MRDMIPLLVFAIPLLGIAAGIFGRWAKMKERQMEHQSQLTAEKAAQYAAHTERLEARVRVLERIATDRGVDVAAEIDALRDERPLN